MNCRDIFWGVYNISQLGLGNKVLSFCSHELLLKRDYLRVLGFFVLEFLDLIRDLGFVVPARMD